MKIATDEELRAIKLLDIDLDSSSALAIKALYARQGWTPQLLNKKIPGVSVREWAAYAQESKASPRWLHVIAALGWAAQVSMPVFYSCVNFKRAWPELDSDIVDVIVCAATLTQSQFEMYIGVCIGSLHDSCLASSVRSAADKLVEYPDSEFHMEEPLDILAFGLAYNRSVGGKLREFRERFDISRGQFSKVLNVTIAQYAGFESPDEGTNIPMNLAVRLKFGFHLDDTSEFISGMAEYPAFVASRRVQQLRERVIIDMCQPLSRNARREVFSLAQNIMYFRQKNLPLK